MVCHALLLPLSRVPEAATRGVLASLFALQHTKSCSTPGSDCYPEGMRHYKQAQSVCRHQMFFCCVCMALQQLWCVASKGGGLVEHLPLCCSPSESRTGPHLLLPAQSTDVLAVASMAPEAAREQHCAPHQSASTIMAQGMARHCNKVAPSPSLWQRRQGCSSSSLHA